MCFIGKGLLHNYYVTSQQHANVSQGWIWIGSCMCCHTKIEVSGQTCCFTQSQYIDTGPTSPSTGPVMPGIWQDGHWSTRF